ncbi:STAS domain-containing protein [Streptomyces sp. SPB162]|uniref:STAS domain-containing protein n=1 Tax=Streptomyces sp. SPB162 TaxID=2940560 RepID=UPI0024068A9A|nr:STAS domain-containing protein [Streptomyces sp. SPB162]
MSLHSEINHANALQVGHLLADLLQASPAEMHLHFDEVSRLATAAASLLFPLMTAAYVRDTSIIIHRADPVLRGKLHELGLDRRLTYEDDPA